MEVSSGVSRRMILRHPPGGRRQGTARHDGAMIRHTVSFRLSHPAGSPQEHSFLAAARELSQIPGVNKFEQLRQVSTQSDFTFSLSMEFDDQQAYAAYNEHPEHVHFVHNRWGPEVCDFQELDFVAL